jgi:hypothetical protein
MKPVKQRNLHKPDEGIYGDCHRAVIASLLELEIEEVPHFGDEAPDGREFYRRVREFLLTKDLIDVNIVYNAELSGVLKVMKSMNPGLYYILGGLSKTGVDHSVICFEDEIVHDPSINQSGIVGPCKNDGLYWVTFLVSSEIHMSK